MAKYYYNDVLLPEIPTVDGYPYAWIRKHLTDEYYYLILCSSVPYLYNDVLIRCSGQYQFYEIAMVNAYTATEWEYRKTDSAADYPMDADRTVLWSNFDIPKGSETATEIYFYGSEPVPEGGSEPEPEYKEKYAVTSERLIEFANTARKIVGSTATLTPEEMATAFGNVQTLIDTANAKTGGGDTDLTSAVGALVEGYGSGGENVSPFKTSAIGSFPTVVKGVVETVLSFNFNVSANGTMEG